MAGILKAEEDEIQLGPNNEAQIKFNSGNLELIIAAGTVLVNGKEPITGVTAQKNSSGEEGPQQMLNFIEGGGCTITVAEDSGNGRINVTISVP